MNLQHTIYLFSFNLLFSSQILFKTPEETEKHKLQNHLISLYGQHLYKANLFTEEALALQSAREEVLQQDIDKPLHYFYLTSDDCEDAYFGYIAYSMDEKTAYIEGIYLDEKYRGRALGKEALSVLEKKLIEAGFNEIQLYVFAHNEIALNCYKKLGYTIKSSYFNGESLIGYQMKKEI